MRQDRARQHLRDDDGRPEPQLAPLNTCIRELDAQFGLDIAGSLRDRLRERLGEQ